MKLAHVFVSALLGFTLLFTATMACAEVKLQGSGASFPFPIYSKWFRDYSKSTDGVRVDYQAKGSGAGIRDYISQVVDFAGSDAAMNDSEIAKAKSGVILLPMTAGEIVLTFNLDGVKELNLPRDVYPLIFTGAISKWNDPKIAAANPGVHLPDRDITVVVRSDSSGTTYVFTGHLSHINETFKTTIGQGKAPQWPGSTRFVKAPKNDGITATVRQTPGSIGYIEYGYAKLTNSPTAKLENKEGHFVLAGAEAGSAALASAEFPKGHLPGSSVPDLRAWVYDPAGAKSYPIATFTWMIFPEKQDPEKAKAARDLVEYCLTEGQKSADSLGYIPLPKNIIETVRKTAQLIK
ncbi:phosphate ABC transporter substrate-binding protein PstS [uncultured Desulfuromonas sp.]|uniref:phosphate ABC transporter substrate-binding protein PstS n=1 Tax=uncultured Desulfuromonas sp. TaxID=181013 RepID=UPI002AAAE8D6|nr:phosphate ABC transporter substrate-binding protein PstS [uncultured Desulfuromonas sp.]